MISTSIFLKSSLLCSHCCSCFRYPSFEHIDNDKKNTLEATGCSNFLVFLARSSVCNFAAAAAAALSLLAILSLGSPIFFCI